MKRVHAVSHAPQAEVPLLVYIRYAAGVNLALTKKSESDPRAIANKAAQSMPPAVCSLVPMIYRCFLDNWYNSS